ncbi:replicative DNA helicase [Streptomyces tanashiensis]|uniref:replicative DNA helicase n=1 Tax=Streptomyces tanashiensis TaxID=67367 RepID=UPI0036EB35C5
MSTDETPAATHFDIQAERAVLRGMLRSRDAIAEVVELLHPADFYRRSHTLIYDAILHLYPGDQAPSASLVRDLLVKREQLEEAGGAAYVNDLANASSHGCGWLKSAERIQALAVLRRMKAATTYIENLVDDGDAVSIHAITDEAQAEILAATTRSRNVPPAAHLLADTLEETLDEIEAIGSRGRTGLPTGFADLDSLTNGLHPGQFIVIASRPAMGKSTFALDILRSVTLKHSTPAVLFTLEQSRREVGMRLLSAEARVALHHMRSGTMTDEDWTRLARRLPDVSSAPFYIQDGAYSNFTHLRSHARRLRAQKNVRLIVVDALHMLTYGTRPMESRYEEISEISRRLKLLATELDVPVIALSQLNRGPESRADKKPMISDLRDSGALEDNADIVILLHRDDAYDRESPRAGEADLIVAKHRQGPVATITVAFQGHYSRFVDMART